MICGGDVTAFFQYLDHNDPIIMEIAETAEKFYEERKDFWLICDLLTTSGVSLYSPACDLIGTANVPSSVLSSLSAKPHRYHSEDYDLFSEQIETSGTVYVFGGGLPIGVCMCGEKLKDVMSPSTHGTTFGANPVVCAGANYVLDTVANDEFLAEVEKKGQYFEDKLTKIDGIKSVRRMGLMIGIELEKGDAHDIAIKCVENGLLIITAKDLLRMLPPLVIDYNEIDEAINILEKTIKENN